MDQEKSEQAKTTHGATKVRIFTFTFDASTEDERKLEVLARRPTRMEMKRFGNLIGDKEARMDAFESLIMNCVLDPSPDPLLDAEPGLVVPLGNKLAEWAGMVEKVEGKKA